MAKALSSLYAAFCDSGEVENKVTLCGRAFDDARHRKTLGRLARFCKSHALALNISPVLGSHFRVFAAILCFLQDLFDATVVKTTLDEKRLNALPLLIANERFDRPG